jgi:hypothetical protein
MELSDRLIDQFYRLLFKGYLKIFIEEIELAPKGWEALGWDNKPIRGYNPPTEIELSYREFRERFSYHCLFHLSCRTYKPLPEKSLDNKGMEKSVVQFNKDLNEKYKDTYFIEISDMRGEQKHLLFTKSLEKVNEIIEAFKAIKNSWASEFLFLVEYFEMETTFEMYRSSTVFEDSYT